MDFYKVPIGFGMALAMNSSAMEAYTAMTEAQKQDEISLHMMGYVKSCTNEIIIEVLSEILGLEDEE